MALFVGGLTAWLQPDSLWSGNIWKGSAKITDFTNKIKHGGPASPAAADGGELPSTHPDSRHAARQSQPAWAALPLAERLRVVRRVRHAIAAHASDLARAVQRDETRQAAETLAAEVIPLADACKFLERQAPTLLAPRRLGRRGRPTWLFGSAAEIRREPLGVVLILAPANYPLLIPGVQILQSLVAGNAVIVKPAAGGGAALHGLADLLHRSGLPDGVLSVLDDSLESAKAAVRSDVDKVLLTGSADTGRQILGDLAPRLVPATMELSGNDAVFVLPGADIGLTVDALAYGLRFNGGATCIAPRRVFVVGQPEEPLTDALADALSALPPAPVPAGVMDRLTPLLDEAEAAGCRFVPARPERGARTMAPLAVVGAGPELGLLREDIFAPVLSVVAAPDEAAALAAAAMCPYALGTSIFGPEDAAHRLAGRVNAGSVTINDLIVPTADPRLPFGGRGTSGYGVTRGGEGLLELTNVKTVGTRHGRFRPHYEPPQADDESLFTAYIEAAHGVGWRPRLAALRRVLGILSRRGRPTG